MGAIPHRAGTHFSAILLQNRRIQAPENRFPTLFTESIILKQTPVCTFERITRCISCQDAKKRNEEAALCFERSAFYEKPPGGGLPLVCRVYRAGIPSTLRFLQQ